MSWYPPSGLIYIPLLEAMQVPDMIVYFSLQPDKKGFVFL
jgi:hypothetical protein